MSFSWTKDNLELLAPAGSFEALAAALRAGADSVYFGIDKLNMRARASRSFKLEDLPEISSRCREKNAKCYLALNTIVYDDEVPELREICQTAKSSGIDAVIAGDLAAITTARQVGLPVHISTQANISNFAALKFYAPFADVVVLARELTLPQIKGIQRRIREENILGPSGNPVRIELFVHGALCVSIAGKCYMSLANTNHSANRGDCLQTCRRRYRVTDDQTGEELVIDNQYVMSPKDICTIRFMDKLIESGASLFKIEGRGRSADYVYRVTRVYREAIEKVVEGSYSPEFFGEWEKQLSSVYNRGFWHGGYYLGNKLGEWAASYGSKATKEKKYVGYVKNYFTRAGIAQVVIEDNSIHIGDEIMATGPTTGCAESRVESIKEEDVDVNKGVRGMEVTIPFAEKLRKNDKVYVFRDRERIFSP